MNVNWKSVVKTLAPTLGTALLGPMGGMAVKVLGDALLGDATASEAQVAEAVMSGLNGDQVLALREADRKFAVRMRELDIDLAKLNADVEKAYLGDVANARQAHGQNRDVARLGFIVLVVFAVVCGGALFGAYQLLVGGMTIKDAGIVAAVFGLIGTIIGYVSAKADQVVSYFFGSSKGSKDKTDALADVIKKLPEQLQR